MRDLKTELLKLIDREGREYTNRPSDRGGPTKFGITETTARAFGYTGRMQDLDEATALKIYTERYWTQPKFDQVALLSEKIAYELFDTGVNMGQGTGVKFLQRALTALNRRGKDYQDLAIDGALGKISLYCLQTYLKARGKDGETVLFRLLNNQQGCRYLDLATNDETQEDYLFGWILNRVE